MKTRICMAAAIVLFVFAIGSAASDDPVPDISEIMTKGHKPGGFKDKINAELKKGTPDWSAVQEQAKDFAKLADALGKNKPPKGSADSWKKQCEAYAKIVTSLDTAAQKKSKTDCTSAMGKLNQSCNTCHKAHKGS